MGRWNQLSMIHNYLEKEKLHNTLDQTFTITQQQGRVACDYPLLTACIKVYVYVCVCAHVCFLV